VLDEGVRTAALLRGATAEQLGEAAQLAASLSESECWSRSDQTAATIIEALKVVDRQRALDVSDRLLDAEGTGGATRGAVARVLVKGRMSMSAEIDGVAIEAFDGFPVSLSRAL